MKNDDLRSLYDLLKKYEQEKCKKYNKVCYLLVNGRADYCPAFEVDYDSDGDIVGGSCCISWILEDLRCSDGKQISCREQGD